MGFFARLLGRSGKTPEPPVDTGADRPHVGSMANDRITTMTSTETAVLGGGCFWCLDAVFRDLDGVVSVESGYAGGQSTDADYESVCSGRTRHAEVVRIVFDPAKVSFANLLRMFFTIHDPTTRDRQGNDVGPQYRSVIFAQDDTQRETAQTVIREIEDERIFRGPIVTELAGASPFYPAESYHQNYFERNPAQSYCMFVVAPKVAKFRKLYRDRLKTRSAS